MQTKEKLTFDQRLTELDQESNLRFLAKVYPTLVDAIRILKAWEDNKCKYNIDTTYLQKTLNKGTALNCYVRYFKEKNWSKLRQIILRDFDCREFADELFIVALTVVAFQNYADVSKLHIKILDK